MKKKTKMTAKGRGHEAGACGTIAGIHKKEIQKIQIAIAPLMKKASFTVFLLSRSPLLVCFIWHRF
ncbi:hypothetical protein ACSE3M_08130 [Bacillus velezensis]